MGQYTGEQASKNTFATTQKQPISYVPQISQVPPRACPDCSTSCRGLHGLQRRWNDVHAPTKCVWIKKTVATDERHLQIPEHERDLLEVAFAREIYKKFVPLTQEQFALRRESITELLYAVSVMIGKRSSSVAGRAAASFVRRGRK
jgi:hypothetical protein